MICSKIQVISHVLQTSDNVKRDPDAVKPMVSFLKWGSHVSIHLPIHLIGCGSHLGSPKSKSSRKAAGSAKKREDNSISGKNLHQLMSDPGIDFRTLKTYPNILVGEPLKIPAVPDQDPIL